MRILQTCAIAAWIGFSGAALAQTTQSTTPGQVNSSGTLAGSNNPNNGGPGSNLSGAVSGNGGMHEGRAAAPDTGRMNSGSMRGSAAGTAKGDGGSMSGGSGAGGAGAGGAGAGGAGN